MATHNKMNAINSMKNKFRKALFQLFVTNGIKSDHIKNIAIILVRNIPIANHQYSHSHLTTILLMILLIKNRDLNLFQLIFQNSIIQLFIKNDTPEVKNE